MNEKQTQKERKEFFQIEKRRHNRNRQLATFELNRVKTTVRKLRLGTVPSGDDQKWLNKVSQLNKKALNFFVF